MIREERATRAVADALQLKNEQLNFYLESLRKQQADIFRVAPGEPGAGDEMTINEELIKISEVMRNVETNLNRESLALATSLADSFSRTFTDRLVMFMSGDGQVTIQQLAVDIGKTLVTTLIQAIIKEMLISPLQKIIAQWVQGGGGSVGDFSFLGSLWQGIKGFLPFFGHGGMIVPPGAMQKFQHGGVVRGPTLGVLGEEGSEIVARMKPMGSKEKGEQLVQNIYLVDQRPGRLGPDDVVLAIAGDLARGGKTAAAVKNVLRTA